MVDLKRYYRLHPKGLCGVTKETSGYVVFFKRFDNETGVELSVEPNYVTDVELIKEKQELEDKLSAVNSILEDITKL